MSSSIIQAFKSLNVSGSASDHENIYEVSYQYLSKVKKFNDIKSFNNCLVALINLDKYDRALDLINKVQDDEIKSQYSIEVAYVYYKTNNSEKLNQLYQEISHKSSSRFLIRGLKHIVAQDHYRNGRHQEALAIYHDLITGNESIDNELDLVTNEFAVLSQLKFSDNISKPSLNSTVEDHHDLLFNKALIELSKGNLTKSMDFLDEALDSLPDMEIDDLNLEKFPILLVKSCILAKLGDLNQSKQILESLKLETINDLLLSLIIKNNYFSLSEILDDNVNIPHRILNYQQNIDKLSNKLTFIQYNSLIKNNLLLLYLSNTLSKKSNFLNRTKIDEFANNGDYSLLSFKILTKLEITNDDLIANSQSTSRKLFKAINSSAISIETLPELTAMALMLLSTNLKQKKYNQSLIVLEKLVEFNLSNLPLVPGLIGSLIQTYEYLNLNEKCFNLLTKLTEVLDSLTTINSDTFNFYKIIGVKLFSLGYKETSKTVFETLVSVNGDDGLINNILHNTNDNLIPVQTLVANIDESILNTNIESLIPSTTVVSSKPGKVEKKKSRPARFSKDKVLKPIDEINIDAERWLPMKLRSYYKPKKSKKSSGHQGAIELKSESPVPSKKGKKKGKK